MHWRRKWQPTPVFLPGESQGRGSLVGFRLWGRTEWDTTEVNPFLPIKLVEIREHTSIDGIGALGDTFDLFQLGLINRQHQL